MDEKNIGNFEEGYTVEYLTKDFKTFTPTKILNMNKTWKIVK